MLVEIPNLEVILGVMVAFLVGAGGVYLYYVISTHFKSKNSTGDSVYSDRFRYYEKQLIDMKIRLDSLGVQDAESRLQEPTQERTLVENGVVWEPRMPETQGGQQAQAQVANSVAPDAVPQVANRHLNSTDYVLHLITDNPMTSRDIQTRLKKSREHTSRLMKRLYVDGYVKRNVESKPYTYSITEKGVVRTKA